MVRSYKQYVIFEGSLADLNKALMDLQSEQNEIVHVHKLYTDTYEILFHVNITSEDIVNAVQDD